MLDWDLDISLIKFVCILCTLFICGRGVSGGGRRCPKPKEATTTTMLALGSALGRRLGLRVAAGARGDLGSLGGLQAGLDADAERASSHAYATKSQSGKGRGKDTGGKAVPLYAREPLTKESDLSKYVSHDVADTPWTPSSERQKR